MRLLLVNDDGIEARGLKALADAALRMGHEVTVVAPAHQCSAYGQHLTLTTPLLVTRAPWPGVNAYAVEGTPADCTRVASALAGHTFDACLSGINRGENSGAGVYYSGTVAAAREAAMLYMPAIAISAAVEASKETLDYAGELAVRAAQSVQGVKLPRFGVINLNVPALPPDQIKELRVCPVSTAYFTDGYERRESPFGRVYFWLAPWGKGEIGMEQSPENSDIAWLAKGHATCTLIGQISDENDFFEANMADFIDNKRA